MVLGCLSELLGYLAKILLYNDPFSDSGFDMSVVLWTSAPAFYSAGIYYTSKHICLTFGSGSSRLRPGLYTWIFISCDVFSIMLQAAGGATASASHDDAVLRIGDDITIAGLATQVATMVAFGVPACGIASVVLNTWHPSWCFPKEEQEVVENPASSDNSGEEGKVGQ